MPRCAGTHTLFKMDDEDDFRLSVVDVYDIAADIGKEFEKIIDQYGTDVLTSLMPRVITALEQLERVAEKQETSGAVIEELRSTITVLEHQKLGLAENRQRYARDLEDIERDMREEKQELSAKLSQLQDENRKLSSCLARSTDTTPANTDDESSLEPEVSRETAVSRLQDALERQRDQLHRLQQQLQLAVTESDQLTTQVERLTQGNKDLRRRGRQSTQQIRQLVEERAELHVSLQEQQRVIDHLQQRLGLAAKENFDLATAPSEPTSDLSSKLVYDRNDPNRPRFTLTELKDILYQRNELKARVSDLEDELNVYRPVKQQRSHIICPPEEADSAPLVNLDLLMLEEAEGGRQRQPLQADSLAPPSEQLPSPSEDDPPVQGPMPYEPDDAPWKRGHRESGIRKFFLRMKKISGVVLGSDEAVLGTPSLRYAYDHHQAFHSTPASAYGTPSSSMIVSSPPSLHSLPCNLTSNIDGTPTTTPTHPSNVHRDLFKSSVSEESSSGVSSRGDDFSSSSGASATATTTTSGGHTPLNTIQRLTNRRAFASIADPELDGSTSRIRSSSTASSFSLEKFRIRFGLTTAAVRDSSGVADSNQWLTTSDRSSAASNTGSRLTAGGRATGRHAAVHVPPLML